MIKKIVFLLLLLSFSFALTPPLYAGIKNPQKPVFCGKEGHLYNISEPDMWEEIVKRAKEVNESFFYDYVRKEVDKSFIMDNKLPYCKNFRIRKYEPIYTLKNDFYVNGVLLYKKGYSFNVLERLNQYLGNQKPVLYFGNLDSNISKEIGLKLINKYPNAIFSVLKGNMKKLAINNPFKIASSNQRLIKSFQVKCDSSIIILGKKYLYIIEIPINKITPENFSKIFNIVDELYKKYYTGKERVHK